MYLFVLPVTIVTKFALYMYCRRYDTPSTQALATDHVNDTVSNAFALMFGALGGCIIILMQLLCYIDIYRRSL